MQKNNTISATYNFNYNKVMDDIRLNYNIDRYIEPNIEKEEELIKEWLILLINDLREEWKNSILLKKNKEGYYWSLLNELENIGLKNN